jgi:hypothetical protein
MAMAMGGRTPWVRLLSRRRPDTEGEGAPLPLQRGEEGAPLPPLRRVARLGSGRGRTLSAALGGWRR